MAILTVITLCAIAFHVSAETYTFNESVISGDTYDTTNRNLSDNAYETISEADQLANTNYSADSDTVTTGTKDYSGGASAFPDAIDTMDHGFP